MKKKEIQQNIIKYFFIVLISLIITFSIVFILKYLSKDKNKIKEKEEIEKQVRGWAAASFDIGDFDNFSLKKVNSTDEYYNSAKRFEACLKAIEYLDFNGKKEVECKRAKVPNCLFLSEMYVTTKLDNIDIKEISIDGKTNEATINIDLSLDIKTLYNTQTSAGETSDDSYVYARLKEPINFYNIKLKLEKEKGKWLITNDKDVRNGLKQFYALYINDGEMAAIDSDMWVVDNE